MPSTKLIALVALAVQASLQMLTMRYSRMPSQPSYVASTAVVTAEAIKMVASAAILFWEQLQGGESAVHLLWRDIVADWRGERAAHSRSTRPLATQAVVHAFTTVMHETGANLGFIVSKHGLQSGVTMYTDNTNIQGLTYQQLQERYFNVWWQRYFSIQVAAAADYVNEYVELINSRRDLFLESLEPKEVKRFYELQRRYAPFGKLMWLMDIGSIAPQHANRPPTHIEHYKSKLVEMLGEEFAFDATCFRSLLTQICSKLQEVEHSFNALFGRNIFLHEA